MDQNFKLQLKVVRIVAVFKKNDFCLYLTKKLG
jgi:hypothetical protein